MIKSSSYMVLICTFSLSVLIAVLVLILINKEKKTVTPQPSTKIDYSESLLINSNLITNTMCIGSYNIFNNVGYFCNLNCPSAYSQCQIRSFKYNSNYSFLTQLYVYTKTGNVKKIQPGRISGQVPSNATFTDVSYFFYVNDSSVQSINDFTQSNNVLYSIDYPTFKTNTLMQNSYENGKLAIYIFFINECSDDIVTSVTVCSKTKLDTKFVNVTANVDQVLDLDIQINLVQCQNSSKGNTKTIIVFPI